LFFFLGAVREEVHNSKFSTNEKTWFLQQFAGARLEIRLEKRKEENDKKGHDAMDGQAYVLIRNMKITITVDY